MAKIFVTLVNLTGNTAFGNSKKALKPKELRNCVLWFSDQTKSHQRRWCSMESCGNHHKGGRLQEASLRLNVRRAGEATAILM
jgi:hypothetical protein